MLLLHQPIALSAPAEQDPYSLYQTVRDTIGGNPGRAVIHHEPDKLSIAFNEVTLDPDGVIRSVIAESRGATMEKLRSALSPFQATVHLPHAFTDQDIAAIEWFCKNIWKPERHKFEPDQQMGIPPSMQDRSDNQVAIDLLHERIDRLRRELQSAKGKRDKWTLNNVIKRLEKLLRSKEARQRASSDS